MLKPSLCPFRPFRSVEALFKFSSYKEYSISFKLLPSRIDLFSHMSLSVSRFDNTITSYSL